ncbi:DNAJ domain-containing protein [Tremella mesenterica]|uniref:DNAJ domain-containing protein n=1 Tax=Tremella mesenterica TaxID=5217 RepID=A0A4Q1BH73_TREME|nr:DNAJ domain-containing protein [Tremella mesenterica]
MGDHPDPMENFFTEDEIEVDPPILYTTLELSPTCTPEEVKKAYRRLALKYHPDKHTSKTEDERAEMGKQFQRVGFAYAVVSDEKRRKRYDETGRTDEGMEVPEGGWDDYFESLFKRVDRKMLDEDKARYQGSEEEKSDLIEAYNTTNGSLPEILQHIPHSQSSDESRFIKQINDLISSGFLTSTSTWKFTSTDKSAKVKRKRAAEGEAKEAEEAAKELGVWDEFYGSGEKVERKNLKKPGKKDTNGVTKGKKEKEDGGEDEGGALAALIAKRQKARGNALDALEEKYRKLEEQQAAKKGKKATKEDIPVSKRFAYPVNPHRVIER